MRKIIVCRGIPASGKSTFAKKWVNENPERRVRINRDDIRNMLGKYWVQSRENLVSKIEDHALKSAMWEGKDIVIDNMNLNPKTTSLLEKLVEMHNRDAEYARKSKPGIEDGVFDLSDYTIEYMDFFTPLDVCIERDSKRENPIGEETIRNIWKKYKHDIWIRENKQKLDNLKTYDCRKQDCILVDMDGTLAFNTNGRPYYGDDCADKIKYDEPLIGTASILRSQKMTGTCKVFIVTGRDETCADATKEWLKENNIPFDDIYVRSKGDYRSSDIVKKEILDSIAVDHNILFVLDDDDKCVKMYRENGVICLQP